MNDWLRTSGRVFSVMVISEDLDLQKLIEELQNALGGAEPKAISGARH